METKPKQEEIIQQILEKNVWGIVCTKCYGGGTDNGSKTCVNCKGTGIYNWKYDIAVEKIIKLLQSERENIIKSIERVVESYTNMTENQEKELTFLINTLK